MTKLINIWNYDEFIRVNKELIENEAMEYEFEKNGTREITDYQFDETARTLWENQPLVSWTEEWLEVLLHWQKQNG